MCSKNAKYRNLVKGEYMKTVGQHDYKSCKLIHWGQTCVIVGISENFYMTNNGCICCLGWSRYLWICGGYHGRAL